jgi:hypothetical protein
LAHLQYSAKANAGIGIYGPSQEFGVSFSG